MLGSFRLREIISGYSLPRTIFANLSICQTKSLSPETFLRRSIHTIRPLNIFFTNTCRTTNFKNDWLDKSIVTWKEWDWTLGIQRWKVKSNMLASWLKTLTVEVRKPTPCHTKRWPLIHRKQLRVKLRLRTSTICLGPETHISSQLFNSPRLFLLRSLRLLAS